MSRVLTNTEFFTYEQEVWLREADGSMRSLRETDYDFIDKMTEHISTFYPKSYAALCSEYKGCAANPSYYRFRGKSGRR